MRRINTPNKAIDKFGAGKHGFKNGNKALGVVATELDGDFFDSVQEELVNLATMNGVALDDAHNDQAKTALIMAMQQSTFSVAVAGGAVNAITAAFTSPILLANLMNGMPLRVRALGANTVIAPTFTPNVGVIPAKTIVKGNNLPLVAGDILGDKYWMTLVYDADLDKWVLQNPAKGLGGSGSSLISANGWKIFEDGLVEQWGKATFSGAGGSVTFPIAFPNEVFSIAINVSELSSNYAFGEAVNPTLGGFTAAIYGGGTGSAPVSSGVSTDFTYIAKGR